MFRSRAQNWCTDRVEPPALISLLVTLLIIFNSLAQPRASGVPNILLSGYQPSYIAVLRVEMLLFQATATSYPRWRTSGRQFRRQSRPQRRVGNRHFSLIMTVVIVVTHGGSNIGYFWEIQQNLSVQENILKLLSNLWRRNFANHDHDGDYCHPWWIEVLVNTADSLSIQEKTLAKYFTDDIDNYLSRRYKVRNALVNTEDIYCSQQLCNSELILNYNPI